MPDARFFETLAPRSVTVLAEMIGGTVIRGGERTIASVAPLSSADEGAIAFLADRKFAAALAETRAGAVIVPASAVEAVPEHCAIIQSGEAQASWARASLILHQARLLATAITAADACEDETVRLAPGVVLGEGVRIGRGSQIGRASCRERV